MVFKARQWSRLWPTVRDTVYRRTATQAVGPCQNSVYGKAMITSMTYCEGHCLQEDCHPGSWSVSKRCLRQGNDHVYDLLSTGGLPPRQLVRVKMVFKARQWSRLTYCEGHCLQDCHPGSWSMSKQCLRQGNDHVYDLLSTGGLPPRQLVRVKMVFKARQWSRLWPTVYRRTATQAVGPCQKGVYGKAMITSMTYCLQEDVTPGSWSVSKWCLRQGNDHVYDLLSTGGLPPRQLVRVKTVFTARQWSRLWPTVRDTVYRRTATPGSWSMSKRCLRQGNDHVYDLPWGTLSTGGLPPQAVGPCQNGV